jgi:lactate dehydrogenase-like 2-hydroxyacid dehydrogenase
LLELENAVMMPHAGIHTAEAVAAMDMMPTQNLIDILDGKLCKQEIV